MNYTLHLAIYANGNTAPMDFYEVEEYFDTLEELVDSKDDIEDAYSFDGYIAELIGITDDENGYQELEDARFTLELAKLF